MADHSTVAHNWAHNTGRATGGHNMFYVGKVIYSYGQHFPIARLVGDIVLMTSRDYSISTSRHKTVARRACSHLNSFEVDNVLATTKAQHAENADAMERKFWQTLQSYARRRNALAAQADLKAALGVAAQYKAYCAWAKVRRKPLAIPDLGELKAELDKKLEKQKRAIAASRKRLEKAAAIELARVLLEDVPRWRAGENVLLPYSLFHDGHLLRERENANGLFYIETTGGARFPSTDARRAWPMLQRLKRVKPEHMADVIENYPAITLGGFEVDRASERGVRAGCTFIEWQEVERMAAQLGL